MCLDSQVSLQGDASNNLWRNNYILINSSELHNWIKYIYIYKNMFQFCSDQHGHLARSNTSLKLVPPSVKIQLFKHSFAYQGREISLDNIFKYENGAIYRE